MPMIDGAPIYLDTMGHLWSSDLLFLHEFAARLGLRLSWFQSRPILYHYDIMSATKRRVALRTGAVAISPRDLVVLMRHAQPPPVLKETNHGE